jgi:tetratricopeptide (TPR) repeat protein
VLALLSTRRSGSRPVSVSVGDSGRFVGRKAELESLETALEMSRTGPGFVAVLGASGIGKSAMLRTFSERVRRRGCRVYEGRCHEAEGVAYKGLDGAIDMLCSDLRAREDVDPIELDPDEAHALSVMFPVLRRVKAFARARAARDADLAPWEVRRKATKALTDLFTGLARFQSVVLFIDDFQWATRDSARLLLDLLSPPAPPILTIVSYNLDAQGHAGVLDEFLKNVEELELQRFELEIQPLSREEVAALLEDGDVADHELDQMLRATKGDPYLLTRAMNSDVDGSPDAADLVRSFRVQLDALSDEERRLLEIVSVSAIPLTQVAACVASGLAAWVPHVVDKLRRSKLVRTLGQSRDGLIEPYHEHVRTNALNAMSDEQHAALHLRLARYLERHSRVDPVILVHHYRCAGARSQARIWSQRAAEDATKALAFSHGANLYRSAAELSEKTEDRIELLVELSAALEQAGRRADAGRVCLEAAALAAKDPGTYTAAELRSRAGEHLILSGHFSEGIELVREALSEVAVTLPESAARSVADTINLTAELATRGVEFTPRDEVDVPAEQLRRVDLELATARALVFTDVRAPWISAKALVDALDAGEPVRVQRALCHFAFANVARAPDHELLEQAIGAAQRLAERDRDDVGLAFASLAKGMLHVQRMEHHAGIRVLREAAHRFSTSGRRMARETAMARVLTGMVCGNYGMDLRLAQEIRERCAADAVEREDMFIRNWVLLLGTWLDLSLGDADAAARNLAEARAAWPNVQDDFFVATSLMHEISHVARSGAAGDVLSPLGLCRRVGVPAGQGEPRGDSRARPEERKGDRRDALCGVPSGGDAGAPGSGQRRSGDGGRRAAVRGRYLGRRRAARSRNAGRAASVPAAR